MKKGEVVHWNWGRGKAEGIIEKEYDKPVRKKIEGASIARNASKEEPAYEIRMSGGRKVIKSESELTKGHKK